MWCIFSFKRFRLQKSDYMKTASCRTAHKMVAVLYTVSRGRNARYEQISAIDSTDAWNSWFYEAADSNTSPCITTISL
jgi:hypothetical protein